VGAVLIHADGRPDTQTDKEVVVMNVIGAFCEYANDLNNSKIYHFGNNQSAGDGKKPYLKYNASLHLRQRTMLDVLCM
jgi:hypothetical protein